jgi:hypothetical protein
VRSWRRTWTIREGADDAPSHHIVAPGAETLSGLDARDATEIQRLVSRFANSFDLKSWDEMAACLADSVDTDYSDLRGTPPETMRRERFVELRRQALQDLQTHHLAGNVEIDVDGDRGAVRLSMVIFRRSPGGPVFNTHCTYRLGVTRASGTWRIGSIAQKVLFSEGDPRIHRGATGAG